MAQQNQDNVHVIISFEIKEDKRKLFEELVPSFIEGVNIENGCISYNIHENN